MLNKKPGDEEYEELQAIINETTRITRSIRHLLNFSRPIKSNKKLNDLNEIIQRIAGNVKHISGNKEIKVKKEIDNTAGKFEFDSEQIEESLLNIVTNAIQAIPSKGEITLALRRKTATQLSLFQTTDRASRRKTLTGYSSRSSQQRNTEKEPDLGFRS